MRRGVAAVLVWAGLIGGCATYSDKTEDIRAAVDMGNAPRALALSNKFLKVKSAGQLPRKLKNESLLVLLERAMILQMLGRHRDSSFDLEHADKTLEMLDIAADPGGAVAEWAFSGAAKRYRASPVEKLSLNAVNMVNYLARGDLDGAAVEARRFSVIRKYFSDYDPEHAHGAFGSYLAGVTYELLGEADAALRYYDEALAERSYAHLEPTLVRLAKRGGYRSERIAAALDGATLDAGAPGPEVLVILCVGRVPHRLPERMPIGLAVGLAGTYVSGDPRVLGATALKWVVFPSLAPEESRYREARVRVDGVEIVTELVTDLAAEIEREYDELRPRLIGAAITRLITRAVAAEGARAAGRASAGGNSSQGAAIGWLAALAVEGALLAADKPDTRSWTLLPARVFIARVPAPPGKHTVEVWLHGPGGEELRSISVDVGARGVSVVQVTSLR